MKRIWGRIALQIDQDKLTQDKGLWEPMWPGRIDSADIRLLSTLLPVFLHKAGYTSLPLKKPFVLNISGFPNTYL